MDINKESQAGVDGSRTHRGPQRDPPPVLKTGEPTGTQPPPCKDMYQLSIPQGERFHKIERSFLMSVLRSGSTDMIAVDVFNIGDKGADILSETEALVIGAGNITLLFKIKGMDGGVRSTALFQTFFTAEVVSCAAIFELSRQGL